MEFVGSAQQNADAFAFLQNKVDKLLDAFSNTTARITPEYVDDILGTSSPTSTASSEPAETTAPVSIRRRDLDSDRSVFSQRVERQMANTGMDAEEARQAVLDRRAARQERLGNLQEELGLGRRKAARVLRYDNRNKVKNETDPASESDYNRSRRIIEMARRKGLTRAEAAGILGSRDQA